MGFISLLLTRQKREKEKKNWTEAPPLSPLCNNIPRTELKKN